MSRRHGKLARKARRVVESEQELEVRENLGKVRAERDRKLHDANRTFDAALKDAQEVRSKQRKHAYDEYEEQRTTILKAFAREGIEADAA